MTNPVTLADLRSLVVTLRDQHRERAQAQRAKCEPEHPEYHSTLVTTREAFGAIHGLASVDLGMVLSAIDSLTMQAGDTPPPSADVLQRVLAFVSLCDEYHAQKLRLAFPEITIGEPS